MIETLTTTATLQISGGDYVETSFGLMYGFAFAAGLTAAPAFLGLAIGVGAGLLLYELI